MSQEEKDKIKEYQKKSYQQLVKYKKEALQNKYILFSQYKKMSEKTLNFDNINVNKKEFHKFKQSVDLDLINVDQIVVSDKFKHSDDGFKYFLGYKDGKIFKPLCIILPQMILSYLILLMHYTCIACITIDYVMRMEKKNYQQFYLYRCSDS